MILLALSDVWPPLCVQEEGRRKISMHKLIATLSKKQEAEEKQHLQTVSDRLDVIMPSLYSLHSSLLFGKQGIQVYRPNKRKSITM